MQGFIKSLVLTIALSVAPTAQADDSWVDIHLASKHGESTYKNASGGDTTYNEINLGLGMSHKVNQHLEWGYGFFKNSYSDIATYVGGDVHTTSNAPVRYGLTFGIVNGYTDEQIPNGIVILPNLTIGNEHVRLKIGVMPFGDGLVTFTAGYRF